MKMPNECAHNSASFMLLFYVRVFSHELLTLYLSLSI